MKKLLAVAALATFGLSNVAMADEDIGCSSEGMGSGLDNSVGVNAAFR